MIAAKWRDYGERLRELLERRPVVTSTEAQRGGSDRSPKLSRFVRSLSNPDRLTCDQVS